MEKSEAQAELSKIYRLKQQLDEEMPEALSTGKLDRAWGLKAEIERRMQGIKESLLPPGSFNKEQKKALEKRGFVIVRLTGQSIVSEIARGNKFFSTWHKDYPEFENLPSRLTEIAFNPHPDKFFLPGSNNKTLFQQQDMVDKYSKELQQELKAKGITGVKAVIGEAPDYVELTFGYTGEHNPLFGLDYNFSSTRTSTTVGAHVTCIGYFFPNNGLNISGWFADEGGYNLCVAPLVVPENR